MKRRLLIVEDDGFKAKDLRSEVSQNYTVNIVSSVRDAVVNVFEYDYDVIILDMALPTFTADASSASGTAQAQGGVEVLRAIKSKGKDTPVILVSQYPDFEMDGAFQPLLTSPPVLSKRYGIKVVGAVIYDFQDNTWATQLNEVISKL